MTCGRPHPVTPGWEPARVRRAAATTALSRCPDRIAQVPPIDARARVPSSPSYCLAPGGAPVTSPPHGVHSRRPRAGGASLTAARHAERFQGLRRGSVTWAQLIRSDAGVAGPRQRRVLAVDIDAPRRRSLPASTLRLRLPGRRHGCFCQTRAGRRGRTSGTPIYADPARRTGCTHAGRHRGARQVIPPLTRLTAWALHVKNASIEGGRASRETSLHFLACTVGERVGRPKIEAYWL